ncbi:hypothetical protein BDW22DRAFT_955735 [Trametopsis cervina]|nr:hypothetical protein BDW22DRAFT_955735 [Trametopsis cervina]
MLNLPQNDTALANIGTAPDWYNTYDPKTMDYVWFIRDQRAQVGYRRNYDNPRLRWASHVAEEAATRATKSLRDLNFEYNRFQSLLEKQQGMLLDACQEPVEVPYDLLLSIPVDTAGMDDVVRNRMMCHFRTLTTESPTDDSNLTPSLPTLIVRHTKPGEDTRQAHNECMMSLVPVVKFMAAVALKDQPVFGLIIRGSVGKLILAWMNTDTDEKYDGVNRQIISRTPI